MLFFEFDIDSGFICRELLICCSMNSDIESVFCMWIIVDMI